MTMHLANRSFTTLSTKKKATKLSSSQRKKLADDWRDYNKQMQRLGASTKTFDEYIVYRQGRATTTRKYAAKDPMTATTHRRQTPAYESGIGIGAGDSRREKQYTGTLIKGIAVTHKSNLVPVMNQEQAEDIARMRR